KRTAITELGLASGMLGSQAKGLIPLLTRQAAQVPTNVALGMADSALHGEDYTKKQLALDVGMGALGGIFRNPQKPRV
ncbi:hypothetical protein, partial [Streptococcus mitis]|uniref:hypothetical protein n=1 Tax=Streptococcus mitis TaxID=28037 RepID=UPI0021B7A0A3